MTSRHYSDLGRLLCAEFPDIAEQLAQKIYEPTPVFSDLSLLPDLLNTYCEIAGVDKYTMIRNDKNRVSSHHKYIFLAIVVKLFSPGTFGTMESALVRNLRKELAAVLKLNGVTVSYRVNDVRVYLKTYRVFADEVDTKLNKMLKTYNHESEKSKDY